MGVKDSLIKNQDSSNSLYSKRNVSNFSNSPHFQLGSSNLKKYSDFNYATNYFPNEQNLKNKTNTPRPLHASTNPIFQSKAFPILNVSPQVEQPKITQKIFSMNQHSQINQVIDISNQTSTLNYIQSKYSVLSRPFTPTNLIYFPKSDDIFNISNNLQIPGGNINNQSEIKGMTNLPNISCMPIHQIISPMQSINNVSILQNYNFQNHNSIVANTNPFLCTDSKLNPKCTQINTESSPVIVNQVLSSQNLHLNQVNNNPQSFNYSTINNPNSFSSSLLFNSSSQVFSNVNISQSTSNYQNSNFTIFTDKSQTINNPLLSSQQSLQTRNTNSPLKASPFCYDSQILKSKGQSMLNYSPMKTQITSNPINSIKDVQEKIENQSTFQLNNNPVISYNSFNIFNQSENQIHTLNKLNPIPTNEAALNSKLEKKSKEYDVASNNPLGSKLETKNVQINQEESKKSKYNNLNQKLDNQKYHESKIGGSKISIYSSLPFKNKSNENSITKYFFKQENNFNNKTINNNNTVFTTLGNEDNDQNLTDNMLPQGNNFLNKNLQKNIEPTIRNSINCKEIITKEEIGKNENCINKLDHNQVDEREKNIISVYATSIITTPSSDICRENQQKNDDKKISSFNNIQPSINPTINQLNLDACHHIENNETKEEDLPIFGKRMKDVEYISKSNIVTLSQNINESNNYSSFLLESKINVILNRTHYKKKMKEIKQQL